MKNQRGYISIPGWWFAMVPVGIFLIAVELVRVALWLYENIEVTLR